MANTISKSNPGSYRFVCSARITPAHVMIQAAAAANVWDLILYLNMFALRFTVLRCRLISPRSMWHCAAVRPITTPRCMATGAYDVEMTRCMVMQCVKYGYCAVCTQFPYFFKRTGCWTHFNARITAAENRTVSVGTTTQQRDTHSSTKFVWT